jgi:hypothetical protein
MIWNTRFKQLKIKQLHMDNAEQPAFPFNGPHANPDYTGLSKRELIAAKVMSALVSDVEVSRWIQADPRFNQLNFKEVVAMNAVEFADALLAELSKPVKE